LGCDLLVEQFDVNELVDAWDLCVDIVEKEGLLLIWPNNYRHQLLQGYITIDGVSHLSLLDQNRVVRIIDENIIRIDRSNFAINVLVFGC
jgi:hypothetical protein